MRIKSVYCHIYWVHTVDFPGREIPVMLLDDGNPGYVVNQWIYSLLEEEITNSRLDIYLRAIMYLYNFYNARKRITKNFKTEYLIRDFIDAQKYGTDHYCLKPTKGKFAWLHHLSLGWQPKFKKLKNIDLFYLKSINEFDKWQVTHHGVAEMNPSWQRLMTEFEIYRDWQERTQWDMFLHLYGSRRHEKTERENTAVSKYRHKRLSKNNQSDFKAMPIEAFIELVELTPNPRDKMLWLIMAGGSLRRSECLHLFLSDLESNRRSGLIDVLLADPEKGMVRYEDNDGMIVDQKREYYFDEMYSEPGPHGIIQPRVCYGAKNPFFSGFKGMTMGDVNSYALLTNKPTDRQYNLNYIMWLFPEMQNFFRICCEEYLDSYFYQNYKTRKLHPRKWPYHPWAFISISPKNYGNPLTIFAVKDAFKRALRRIGMDGSGLGTQSLRHMYGYCLANILEVPLHEAQTRMHHATSESTKVYYRFSPAYIQNKITANILQEKGLDPEFYLLPETPVPDFPSHWSDGLVKRYR